MRKRFYGDMPIPEFTLLKGDCLETLKKLKENSIDAVLCDPPYHLTSTKGSTKGFMGKNWDGGDIAFRTDVWKECFRVLKPGGHLVAFGGTRTIHRITCAIEDSGFEIRDQLNWLYFSGFPKSLNISKAIDRAAGAEREVIGINPNVASRKEGSVSCTDPKWGQEDTRGKGFLINDARITAPATEDAKRWKGWGTALKPAAEPACLARKPIEKGFTVAQNVLKWGTGGLNIDKSRFAYGDPCFPLTDTLDYVHQNNSNVYGSYMIGSGQKHNDDHHKPTKMITQSNNAGRWPANIYQCPKPSRKEKEAGLEHLTSITGAEAVGRKEGSAGVNNPRAGAGRTAEEIKNTHPTVKPLQLFQWLANLICSPGGTILDPFLGSGTTAVAGFLEGFNVIGCELTPEYWPIIEGRVSWAEKEWKNQHRQYKLF